MHEILIWDTSLYSYIWMFLIYSFAGWCVEVSAHAVTKEKFINRGFLNGPYCPIYGVGLVLVTISLAPISKNLPLLFAGAVILTTILELVTGFILKKAIGIRWWDYSNQKYNFGGYICLKYSFVWGLSCVFVIKIINPLVLDFIDFIPRIGGEVLIIIFALGMLTDLITTIISLGGMSKRMKKAAFIREKLHEGSDRLGELLTAEILDIQNKIDQLPDKKNVIQKRLEKAYPGIANLEKTLSKEELMRLLKQKIKEE